MTKRYYFNNDSYIEYSPCDCCDYEGDNEIVMECYNLDNDRHPDVFQSGSAHSLEECYEQVLQWEGILSSDNNLDTHNQEWREGMDWEEALLYLEGLMVDNKLQVEIEKTHYDDSCGGVYP